MFWSMLILVAAADACCENASLPRPDPQELQVRYVPHGIQLPTAPYPARRNPAFQARRAHFQLPPPENSQKEKENKDLFGQDPPLGPYPPLADLKGHNLSPPQIPRYQGQEFPREESLEYLTPRGQGILDGLAYRSHALEPNIPGMQNSGFYPGLQQNGGYRPLNPWYGLPVPTQPSYLLGFQQGLRPLNARYGQPVPTAMGPYPQRRLKPMQFSTTTRVQTQPAPLRDIESSTKSNKLFDSWLGAHGRDRNQPPSLEQFGPLVPPQLRSGRSPSQRQVTTDFSEERVPQISEAKGYVKPITRRTFVMHGLLWHLTETTTLSPPPLLRDEDGFMEEFEPESDDRSIFSEEHKHLPKLPPDVPNTFDNI
ncbi:uncharacterized protein LOC133533433 [Cydia pomonella]|uniref:uncharacterized protein LOC133531006 n=1 Tax=Cydia pomonella TaxID=82600 RepID=UPI002ADDAA59|nr:uncharacterized protein LOC133531006 [Cydia pomonella]XP_061728398.1 uncharacterized protein LOC133533433 [Cydia pomonella]